MDMSNILERETRHPHRDILEVLSDADEDSALWPKRFLVGDEKIEDLKQFSDSEISAALDELEQEEIIVSRPDLHSIDDRIGISQLVDLADAPYQQLKSEVYAKAKAAGLWPTWRPRDGWRLINGGRLTVFSGPMAALAMYLDELNESRLRNDRSDAT